MPGIIGKISFPKSMRWNSEVYYGISVFVFVHIEIPGIGFIRLVKCFLAIM